MLNKANCNVISISLVVKGCTTPEYTFIPIPLLEYKKNKEKYDKELSTYYTFTPTTPNFKFRSIYEEVDDSRYARKVDWRDEDVD